MTRNQNCTACVECGRCISCGQKAARVKALSPVCETCWRRADNGLQEPRGTEFRLYLVE